MRRAFAVLLALVACVAPRGATARSGPTRAGIDNVQWAIETGGALGAAVHCVHHTANAYAPELCRVAGVMPLMWPTFLGGGFTPPPQGAGGWSGDTYTPQSGTFTVAGNMTIASPGGAITFTNGAAGTGTNFWIGRGGLGSSMNSPTGSSNGFFINNVEQAQIDVNGITLTNSASVPGAAFGIGRTTAQTAMEFNVPTGDAFLWTINQGSEGQLSAIASDPTGFVGQFNVAHYGGATAAPSSPTAGTGCGTSSAPGSAGNDANPELSVTCGATGTVSATIISATWATAYTGTNHCNWTCANAATCALATTTNPFDSSTTSGPAILANTVGLPAGTYKWRGVCWQQ